MRLIWFSVTCLLAAAGLAGAEELPPNWWLITDEDPFAVLQQELGDSIPDLLKGGPVAAGAALRPNEASGEAESSEATAGAGSSGADASASVRPGGASASVRPGGASEEAAKAPGSAGSPGRPGRFPPRESEEASDSGPFAPPPQESLQPRPPTRQPGGGPIVFPTDRPLGASGDAERFSPGPVFGGLCSCAHPTSCIGQPDAPQGECATGQVCCPPEHRYRPKCGIMTPTPRSAQAVRDSQAPWMAALLEKVPNGYIFVCGGSLINQQVVLTAARCVQRYEKTKDSLVVRLGENDILSNEEFYPPVEIAVKDVIIHANYSRAHKYNDLALLILRDPAPLRPGLDTICVRRQTSEPRDCSIHSYGLREAGSTAPFDLRLREADQAPLPNRECQRVLRSSQKGNLFQLHPSFQCTTSDVTCDLGEDRAGSPLTCPDLSRREHQLRGVVAWGVGCQSQQKPGVYTSVDEFYSWIDGMVTGYFRYIESAFGPFNQV